MEEWKDIEGYEGFYQVSTHGRVKSLDRLVWDEWNQCYRKYKERILRPGKSKRGYMVVVLSKSGETTPVKVHRLVLSSFSKNPYNKPQVNHKDGDKSNNVLSNLEWATCSENMIHAYKNGLCSRNKKPIKRLTSEESKMIKTMWRTNLYLKKDLSKTFNVSPSTIRRHIQ